jgi:hypothetical protein
MLGRGAERWLCFPDGWQRPRTPDVPSSGSEIENEECEECNASARLDNNLQTPGQLTSTAA